MTSNVKGYSIPRLAAAFDMTTKDLAWLCDLGFIETTRTAKGEYLIYAKAIGDFLVDSSDRRARGGTIRCDECEYHAIERYYPGTLHESECGGGVFCSLDETYPIGHCSSIPVYDCPRYKMSWRLCPDCIEAADDVPTFLWKDTQTGKFYCSLCEEEKDEVQE